MGDGTREKPCYGVLEKVFPVGERGLREVPGACFECPHRVPCLKAALETREGLKMRDDLVDRAAAGGMIGRLKRWSRKKTLDRLMKERDKGNG